MCRNQDHERRLATTRRRSSRVSPPRLPRRHVDDDSVPDDDIMEKHDKRTGSPTTRTTTASTVTPPLSPCQLPSVVPPLSSARQLLLRPHSVTAVLHDFYDDLNSNIHSKSRECWKALYEKYHAPGYLMVRPSGNPIDDDGFIDLFCCEDIRMHKFHLVRVQDVRILAQGLVAIVIYTVDQYFSYKGILQQDRAVLSCIMEEVCGDIKIKQEHRSTGKPIQELRWEEHHKDAAAGEEELGKQNVF